MPNNIQETALTETAINTKIGRNSRTELEKLDFSTNVPYFFPLNLGDVTRGGTKDIFTISQAQGWTQELTNPVSSYVDSRMAEGLISWLTDCVNWNSEDVRARWEAQKVGLTKNWKQRHREAVKRQRRGGAFDVLD
jgi:queuine/archaeosine tRNA-ribosyltransferase